jgi:predicted GNAT family acetyltransferase
MSTSATVQHDTEARKFFVRQDGGESFVSYVRVDDSTLDFRHTVTEPALRGRGLAAAVVTAGLDYAREHGMKVIPTCSYVAAFLDSHPEYADLRASA